MTTQRNDNHSLVGILVLGLLLVLGTGGCGDSNSTGRHAIETVNQVPAWVGSESMTYVEEEDTEMVCDEPTGDEYEAMGYQEPGYSDTLEAGTVTDGEYRPEQTGDVDDEACETETTSTSCYGEEDESTEAAEEPGMVEEDDSTYRDVDSMPVAIEEEDTSAQNNDTDEGSMVPSTVDEEEAGDQMISEDSGDESDENTVAPWISGEDETSTDPNPDDTMSDTTEDAPVSD